jgi:putative endonuclease
MSRNKQVGQEGEQIAREYLQAQGYRIHNVNVRLGRDEIDIIAYDPEDKVIVFVEVKNRQKADKDFGPELNVDKRKKKAMQRAARLWIAEHDFEGGYRLDLVCVVAGQVVDHYKELSWE